MLGMFDIKKKQGPHSIEIIAVISKPKQFMAFCQSTYQKFQEEKIAAAAAVGVGASSAAAAFQEVHLVKRQRASLAARDKAAEMLNEKKQRRLVRFASDPDSKKGK